MRIVATQHDFHEIGVGPVEADFCQALFTLPGGTIVAEGASARGPFTVAITGGTGR
jgi:hypothetical protein